jgi:hypothetical protein
MNQLKNLQQKNSTTPNAPYVSTRIQVSKHAMVLKPCKRRIATNPNPKTMP